MLNPLHILKHSMKLSAGSLAGIVLSFGATIIVARMLGPDMLGQVNFVLLWLGYAGLIRLGLLDAGHREMADRLGRGEQDEARRVQNHALSGEALWSVVPASLLLCASLLADEPLRRVGFVIAPLIYLATIASRVLASTHLVYQHFGIYGRMNAVRSIGQPLLLMGLVLWIGAYAYFIAPLIIEWTVVALYLLRGPSLGLRWELNGAALRRLLRYGAAFGLGNLVYWAYRLVGSTSVAMWFSVQDLGYYTFVAMFVTVALQVFGDFSGVLTPILWSSVGKSQDTRQFHREYTRLTVFVVVAGCMVANLAQAGFGPFISLAVPQFVPGIEIFNILAFNIVVLTTTFVPSLLLSSAQVNKQWLQLSIAILALAINIVANYVVMRSGLGVTMIAWNDIWVQLIVVVVGYAVAQRHMFSHRKDAWSLYSTITALCMCCVLTYWLLEHFFAIPGEASVSALIISMILRVVVAGGVWLTVGAVIYALGHRQVGVAAQHVS